MTKSLNINTRNNMNKNNRHIRIHGDNIVECERSLALISAAYNITPIAQSQFLYKPTYILETDKEILHIDLLPGHDRWGVNIADILLKNGGVLREGADSYITEVKNNEEQILFAIEYCSALPAGNNAWQRNGRAYSSIMAGIPYLYFAEIGGVELDQNRNVKAPRFPNPVIPFSYIMMTNSHKSYSIAIYKPHPSISDELYNNYKDIFGQDESLSLIKALFSSENQNIFIEKLKQKELLMVKKLANQRKSIDTFRNNQWDSLLNSKDPAAKISKELSNIRWKKKTSEKVNNTKTYKELFSKTQQLSCLTIGAKDLPICIIPLEQIKSFQEILNQIYPPELKIKIDSTKPLAIVWVTGFKPKGDDSRPDRGLTPLARMILNNSANILTIISGPAKSSTWDTFANSPNDLAKENGLWQSILKVANYVLIDSTTSDKIFFYPTNLDLHENQAPISFKYSNIPPSFSEQDTDTAIHQLFSRKERLNIFESLCNPPGGDWSGISIFMKNGDEYRWTSLPRVSQVNGKRPDHVIQYFHQESTIFIIIESKFKGKNLENGIGTSLKAYIDDLFKTLPTAYKKDKNDWRLFKGKEYPLDKYTTLSVGAFIYTTEKELKKHLERGNLDAVIAFEFKDPTKVHILCHSNKCILLDLLKEISKEVTCFEV